jgi:phage-related protein
VLPTSALGDRRTLEAAPAAKALRALPPNVRQYFTGQLSKFVANMTEDSAVEEGFQEAVVQSY